MKYKSDEDLPSVFYPFCIDNIQHSGQHISEAEIIAVTGMKNSCLAVDVRSGIHSVKLSKLERKCIL